MNEKSDVTDEKIDVSEGKKTEKSDVSGAEKNEKSYVSDSRGGNTVSNIGVSLEKLNLGPRKKLLVLSLGGFLVRRFHELDNPPTIRPPDLEHGRFKVFKRPFCEGFLNFCFERFEVGIWSSAREYNIYDVLEIVMGDLRRKLLFIWDQEKCTDTGLQSLEKEEKPLFLKELKKIWEQKIYQGKYSASNTLLIDDTPYKGLLNPPNTAIYPRKYRVEIVDDAVLGPKGKMRLYLDGVVNARDVTCYVKENRFGQPAITESHPDYGYYSKITRLVH
jgi:hypothetical protein